MRRTVGQAQPKCYPASLRTPKHSPQPERAQREPERVQHVEPARLRWIVLALAALFLIGLFSTELADPDAWWHLRSGAFIAAQHRLPNPDPFAWTTAHAPTAYPGEPLARRFNLTHEWLAQLLLYALYATGGFGAIVFSKALLLAATCGLAGCAAARRAGDWWWGVAAACATASLALEFAADRPALLTFFFVALFIAICESGRRLWLLPLASLLWANLHGGFFLGWVVCGAYAADALVRDRAAAKRFLLAAAAAVLVSGANPNGFRVIETLLAYRQSAMQASLVEWTRPYLWGPPYAFDVLLYAAAACLLLAWRRVRLAHWLLFAAFAAAALMAFRNLILVGILAPILIAAYWPRPFRVPLALRYATAALLAAGLGWGAVSGRFFQFRAAEWRYPSGAVQFLAGRHIDVPLFNTYEYGGYLIWRGRSVFVDGRALSETVYGDYYKILNSAPPDPVRFATLSRYGAGAIVANGFEYVSGALYPLVVALSIPNQSEWKLVYEDPQSLVFLRDVPPGVPVLPLSRISQHLVDECELHIGRDPAFPRCARTLGDLFLRLGDREHARRLLALYLEHTDEDDRPAKDAYHRLLTAR